MGTGGLERDTETEQESFGGLGSLTIRATKKKHTFRTDSVQGEGGKFSGTKHQNDDGEKTGITRQNRHQLGNSATPAKPYTLEESAKGKGTSTGTR